MIEEFRKRGERVKVASGSAGRLSRGLLRIPSGAFRCHMADEKMARWQVIVGIAAHLGKHSLLPFLRAHKYAVPRLRSGRATLTVNVCHKVMIVAPCVKQSPGPVVRMFGIAHVVAALPAKGLEDGCNLGVLSVAKDRGSYVYASNNGP